MGALCGISLNQAQSRLGHAQAVAQDEHTRQQSQAAGLVGGSQMRRYHVDQRANAERRLQQDKVHDAGGTLFDVLGKQCTKTTRA